MLKSVTLAIAVALSSAAALASPATEAVVEQAASDIETRRGEDLAKAIVARVDVPRIARFVLGKHARTATSEELAEFNKRFEMYLIDALTDQSDDLIGARVEVIGSSDRNERDSVVLTHVKVPGQETINMRWRLLKRNGEWKAVDLEVFGLWLAIEQRAQVQIVMDRPAAKISDLYSTFDAGAPQNVAAL